MGPTAVEFCNQLKLFAACILFHPYKNRPTTGCPRSIGLLSAANKGYDLSTKMTLLATAPRMFSYNLFLASGKEISTASFEESDFARFTVYFLVCRRGNTSLNQRLDVAVSRVKMREPLANHLLPID